MMYQRVADFLSPEYLIRSATAPWEINGARRLRHQVFVTEQKLFDRHDRDDFDAIATPLVALSTLAGQADQVVGTVRIHEETPGTWRGSRLAVGPVHRQVGWLGAELIRLAVSTAHGRGCTRFLAQVQMPNVRLFKRLRWQPLEEISLHGTPHMLMQADLSAYPAIPDPAQGWVTPLKRRRHVAA
ncbi:MAG: GNAT family N-acetyltransferase [Mangrovicoccus sp.]|nr:GNAT family N-acetyltransferase [Mangrovicoccus sp.]